MHAHLTHCTYFLKNRLSYFSLGGRVERQSISMKPVPNLITIGLNLDKHSENCNIAACCLNRWSLTNPLTDAKKFKAV